MDKLNEIAKLYLHENGITISFFAKYIGTPYDSAAKWLNGKIKKLSYEQNQKVHDFLNGEHLRPIEKIMKKEGE